MGQRGWRVKAARTGLAWYDDDLATPATIQLCPAACSASRATGSQLAVQGCP